MKKKVMAASILLLFATGLVAHPHFQKSSSAKLPGNVEVGVSFFTVPSNMTHAENADAGAFVTPGFPKLELSAPLTAGSVEIPAGTYTIGAIKNGANDWTMALSPGALAFGAEPDLSKLIKLDSSFETSSDATGHLVVDINPGEGKFEGKAVIVLGFGTMWLQGLLSDAA